VQVETSSGRVDSASYQHFTLEFEVTAFSLLSVSTWTAAARHITSIGHNPFTETIYFRKYSVYEGFLGENTRLRELRRRRDFGRFWVILGSFGLFRPVFA